MIGIVIISITIIPNVDSICFLGVTVSSDLKWYTHITNVCAKARQQLGITHRTFNQANSPTLLHLYRVLVLPTLDYCSSVWDPRTSLLVNKLESVQRLAARFITNCWFTPHSSTHPIHSLGLCPLKERRWRQKTMICARILKGHSIIPPTYFTPHPNPRRPTKGGGKATTVKLASSKPKGCHHSYPLVTPFARTASHQSSFFISCTRVWNSLPDQVVSAPSRFSFKKRLKSLSLFSIP